MHRKPPKAAKTASSNFAAHDGGGRSVGVMVRIRPLLRHEIGAGHENVIDILDRSSFAIKVPSGLEEKLAGPSKTARSGPSRTTLKKNYSFDNAFGVESSQTSIFEESGLRETIEKVMEGYSATVFAYGQTGSGKTYTMSGLEERILSSGFKNPDSDGIIPRSLLHLFRCIERVSGNGMMTYATKASFLEIYNETVIDLLNPDRKNVSLSLRQYPPPTQGFYVQNLLELTCNSLEDLMCIAAEGHRNRHVASHQMNQDSSRSHSIFTIHIEGQGTEQGIAPRNGKLVFVDLAGSENLKSSSVIAALGDISSGKKPANFHVPFRDSVLTKLLMDALGGSCITTMIACISPSSEHVDETMRTLQYAQRTQNIKTKPAIRVDIKDEAISRLTMQLRQTQFENSKLRQALLSANIPLPDLEMSHSDPTRPLERAPNTRTPAVMQFHFNNDTGSTFSPPSPSLVGNPANDWADPFQMHRSSLQTAESKLWEAPRQLSASVAMAPDRKLHASSYAETEGLSFLDLQAENALLRHKILQLENAFLQSKSSTKMSLSPARGSADNSTYNFSVSTLQASSPSPQAYRARSPTTTEKQQSSIPLTISEPTSEKSERNSEKRALIPQRLQGGQSSLPLKADKRMSNSGRNSREETKGVSNSSDSPTDLDDRMGKLEAGIQKLNSQLPQESYTEKRKSKEARPYPKKGVLVQIE